MTSTPDKGDRAGWRDRWYVIIFEADTPMGKAFDVALIWMILLSVLAVIIDSVATLPWDLHRFLYAAEWFFTAVFTVEYAARLLTAHRPRVYARSFYGVVDLLAIVPTYLSLLVPGSQAFLVIRVLRLLRIFRVLKLVRYLDEARLLFQAMRASARKIMVFLYSVLLLVTVIGTLMYIVEGSDAGFTSIPRSMYWAIVTVTTVGYGDIAPQTVVGQMLASVAMVMGYGIIAVPTGIVTVEMAHIQRRRDITTQVCSNCNREGHDPDAEFCKFCGEDLHPERRERKESPPAQNSSTV
ncbi:MAG: ion transporter [Pseudomonadota bacterium]|nr:ion transporter [Pseudomonadota bacterium]